MYGCWSEIEADEREGKRGKCGVWLQLTRTLSSPGLLTGKQARYVLSQKDDKG